MWLWVIFLVEVVCIDIIFSEIFRFMLVSGWLLLSMMVLFLILVML